MQVFSTVGGTLRTRMLAVLLLVAAGVLSTEFADAAERSGPRVLLIHDMEGLSGQSDPYTFLYGHPAYPRGQALLIADVNKADNLKFKGMEELYRRRFAAESGHAAAAPASSSRKSEYHGYE